MKIHTYNAEDIIPNNHKRIFSFMVNITYRMPVITAMISIRCCCNHEKTLEKEGMNLFLV
jgi:hypothetical protein